MLDLPEIMRGDRERPRMRARPIHAWPLLCLAWVLVAGCVTVRPEDREFHADPAMRFGAGGMAERHEQHVLDNREGSTGAGSTRGGGCGCN